MSSFQRLMNNGEGLSRRAVPKLRGPNAEPVVRRRMTFRTSSAMRRKLSSRSEKPTNTM
jgi:hypothetical protein